MTLQTTAPVAETTINVTMGRINTPVKEGIVCGCNVNLISAGKIIRKHEYDDGETYQKCYDEVNPEENLREYEH